MPDSIDFDEDLHVPLWTPFDRHGWTSVQTMLVSPKTHSLFDADSQLKGKVYQRFGRVICWAPFTWAENAYRNLRSVKAASLRAAPELATLPGTSGNLNVERSATLRWNRRQL